MLSLLSLAAGVIVIAIACYVLAAWEVDISVLKSIVPGWPKMMPATAFCFILSGLSLCLFCAPALESQAKLEIWGQPILASLLPRLLAKGSALVVSIIALVGFTDYFSALIVGLDPSTVVGGGNPENGGFVGQLPANVAFDFLLSGIALLLLDVKIPRIGRLTPLLSIIALLVALLPLINYAFRTEVYFGLDLWSKMALHEAFCFVVLSIGIIFANPESGALEVLTSESRGGYLSRRLLLAAVVVPCVLGWLCLLGQQAGYYDARKGMLLFIILSILLILVVIWVNATSLRELDHKYLESEEELRKTVVGLDRQLREQATETIRANKDLWGEIQERERLEEELACTEEYLKYFYEGAPEDLYENIPIGVHKVSPDGQILWANRAELEMLGYTGEEYVGRQISELHVDQEVLEDLLNRLWSGEKLDNYEARLLAKDGSIKHVLISSDPMGDDEEPVYARCFTRDLTDYRVAEDARGESEEFDLRLLECTADGIQVLDQDGRLISINAQGLKQLEIDDPAPHLGRPWIELWDEEAREAAGEAVEIAKAGSSGHFVKYCRTLRGKPRWWDVMISPAPNREGGPARLISISRDITANKQIEEERDQLLMREQAARELAEDASRLKDEFLTTVSHELRAPLNAILGWVKLLRKNRLSPEESLRALETVERSAQVQNRIINDLLDVSRIITGKQRLNVVPIKPARVIESVVESMLPGAEAKAIRLETVLDFNAGPISCDPDRLQQVVWNLLSNAVKFTPKGGRVQVRLERIHTNIEIIISDTGVGINPEFLPFVFDRFRQSNSSSTRRQGGLGLGLAIVRHLTEMHGGSVRAESAGAGRGATFVVRLPLIMSNTAAVGDGRPHPTTGEIDATLDRPTQFDGLQVLMVDGDPDSRELIRTILAQHGAEVETAGSADEAVSIFARRKGWQPDLLISDLEIVGSDGYPLLHKLRALETKDGRRIPAIALTAQARVEDRLRSLAGGFQMHIAKPVESIELLTVVASLTGKLSPPPDQLIQPPSVPAATPVKPVAGGLSEYDLPLL
ncbi:MAG TPA: ATP-binding protein [Blastocatellia bacterium]|nr:ATP-binding protein [Blastocatellia bacterium]